MKASDVADVGLVMLQLVKIYQLFDNATKGMTPEEKAELWENTKTRAKQAREIWEQA